MANTSPVAPAVFDVSDLHLDDIRLIGSRTLLETMPPLEAVQMAEDGRRSCGGCGGCGTCCSCRCVSCRA